MTYPCLPITSSLSLSFTIQILIHANMLNIQQNCLRVQTFIHIVLIAHIAMKILLYIEGRVFAPKQPLLIASQYG